MHRHMARSLVVVLLLLVAPGLTVRDALGATTPATETEAIKALTVARSESSLSLATEGAQAEIVAPKEADVRAIRNEIALHDRLSRQWLLASPGDKALIGKQIKELAVKPMGVSQFLPTLAGNAAIFLPFTSISSDFCAVALLSAGYCHAGIFNSARFNGRREDAPIKTANRGTNSPGGDGAKYETVDYWNNPAYSEVREMNVPLTTTRQRAAAVTAAAAYQGPYSVLTPVWSNNAWYCSKVVWRAYWDAAHIALGPVTIVTPGDIRWSPLTRTVRVYR